MTSYDKVVKLACKPKAAPPKAKYLDPIIAATWSEDGAVHDVCKALSPRFREPNAIVVFKALIVLHTMIRNGATDNVLSYLSSGEVLRLQNVSAGNWEGYHAPLNLQNYAIYLDSRIRAYHDLKHDAVRVQAESNRDLRNSNSIEEDGYRNNHSGAGSRGRKKQQETPPAGPTRSKTIMGRKLRIMTVEKGLLRETKAVHRMIDALVECRFYLDDLEDELTTTALRMLVKDLLILFQAGNEGVINVLEHYFEMSHVDAQEALKIYRHFCKQTERVVEYLGVAKKLQNLLNVPVPNLKHAPVSLAGALQEYLDDPNFEQNRIEYKTNKEAAEKNATTGGKKGTSSSNANASSSKPASPPPVPTISSSSAPTDTTSTAKSPLSGKDMVDFFSAIDEEQPTMFNPQTNSPSNAYFNLQAATNPFAQQRQMMMQMTGQPQAFGIQQQMQPNPTGLMQQQTGYQQSNPFALQVQQQLQPQPTGHRPFSSFLQPQATGFMQQQQTGFMQPQQQQQQQQINGFMQPQQQQQQPTGFMQPQQQQQPTGFLQPQATGSNPFRQSMLFPQTTGMALFSGQNQNSPFLQSGPGPQLGHNPGQSLNMPSSTSTPGFAPTPSFNQFSSSSSNPNFNVPPRPSSTPLTAFASSSSAASPPVAQPVKTHQTGTKNPFGPIVTTPPPVPKPPTLMELAMGGNAFTQGQYGQQQQQQQQQQQTQSTGSFNASNGFGFNSGALSAGGTDMASIASSFATSNTSSTGPSSPPTLPNTTTSGSMFSDSIFSSLSSQPTGATTNTTSSGPSISISSPLKSQTTGFGGIKAFKPSSSFGASLLESLPPIPGSAPGTPAITGNGSGPGTGAMSAPTSPGSNTFGLGQQPTGFGAFSAQPTGSMGGFSSGGSTLGQGLRPQMTGGPNPFRASMVGTPAGGAPAFNGGASGFGASSFSNPGQHSPFGAGASAASPSMGANLFAGGGGGGAFGTSFNAGGGMQQQQQNSTSLI